MKHKLSCSKIFIWRDINKVCVGAINIVLAYIIYKDMTSVVRGPQTLVRHRHPTIYEVITVEMSIYFLSVSPRKNVCNKVENLLIFLITHFYIHYVVQLSINHNNVFYKLPPNCERNFDLYVDGAELARYCLTSACYTTVFHIPAVLTKQKITRLELISSNFR